MNAIDTEFQKIDLNYDRTSTDVFQLPYDLDAVSIQPNELAVSRSFNIKIQKLYDNFLYLYGLCSVADFKIPRKYEGWVGYTSLEKQILYLYDDETTNAVAVLSSVLFASSQALAFYSTNAQYDQNLIFTNGQFISLNGINQRNGYYDPVNLIQQSSVDPLSGSINFYNITGIAQYKTEQLFISDATYNNLYSYNLGGAISDDNIKNRQLFQLNVVGGRGTSQDRIKFNNIGKIAVAGDVIIVEDKGNKTFKVYDRNLNWLNSTITPTLFNAISTINAMAYSEKDNRLYVASNTSLFLLDISTDYDLASAKSYDFSSILTGNEHFVDIKFANYDKDVFYLLSNKNLYKKWITKPEKNIGTLRNSIFNDDNFRWITTASTASGDDVLIYAVSQDLTRSYIAVYRDNLSLTTLFKTDNSLIVYSKEDVLIDPQEYNCSWVYNKSIKKMLYNMSLLVNNIGYRFFTDEDDTGTPVFLYRGYNNFFRYNAPLDTNKHSNVFINENFQAETINRCFKQIHDYQQLVLQTIVTNDSVVTDLTPYSISNV
jgi:hypothetical protein